MNKEKSSDNLEENFNYIQEEYHIPPVVYDVFITIFNSILNKLMNPKSSGLNVTVDVKTDENNSTCETTNIKFDGSFDIDLKNFQANLSSNFCTENKFFNSTLPIIRTLSEIITQLCNRIDDLEKKCSKFDKSIHQGKTLEDISNKFLIVDKAKFYRLLCTYCDEQGYTEPQLYQKANISKAVYSNIRSMAVNDYIPKKETALCLCIALHLTLSQAQEMLQLLGYSLSNNSIIDKIIAWCLHHGKNKYDVQEINNFIYTKTGKSPLINLPREN